MNISSYLFGSQTAFGSDCWSSDAMRDAGLCPDPLLLPGHSAERGATSKRGADPAASLLLDGVSDVLTQAFDFARHSHIETCVGIESGNAIPTHYPGNKHAELVDYYKGMLLHINATYKASCFWIWTGEGWPARHNASIAVEDPIVQTVVSDLLAAHAAWQELGLNGTTTLATGGWTVGPMTDRTYFDKVLPPAYTLSSINEYIGNANVEPAYRNITSISQQGKGVESRKAWSIPWLEDDSAMIGTQLWVNRTLAFSAAAAAYGATGLVSLTYKVQIFFPSFSCLVSQCANDISSRSL